MPPRQINRELNEFIEEPPSNQINRKENNISKVNHEENDGYNQSKVDRKKNNYNSLDNQQVKP